MKKVVVVVGVLMLGFSSAGALGDPPDASDGEVRVSADGTLRVWDAVNAQWSGPVEFWLAFAARRGGLTWGRSNAYPPYAKVEEHDTILIELDSGACLMEFFHNRWRRARDVWRWGEELNAFGGCPHVFD